MPYLPSDKGDTASFNDEYELFSDFALLASYYNFSHEYILQMPHSHFLAYIKQCHVKELKKSEEGREYLDKARRYMNPRKDADLSAIRAITGYTTSKTGGGDN
ncbi:hypothetical protein BkAM31D_13500 [Halalkalibacter krulwichiae]|uniref:Uncharacterized protein n=1 Tax=Halalkalibacter krulwichiae TaxID=199441 RepID=A0A1X9MBH4_9BACI|nr:hypothetical protein [Halalkalibacter krulwichiae]ARK30767.1 hypothetical protein BkAM31D_13500 [Halalkalibacter krulwichiae]